VQRLTCAAFPLNVAYDGKYANAMPKFGMLVWYSTVQLGFHQALTAGAGGVVMQCLQSMCAVEYLYVRIGHAPVCLCNVRHTSRVTLAF